MSLFSRIFAICIAVTTVASFLPSAFAQTASAGTTDVHGELQRTADFVNLMRSVFAPDQPPVLVSPAERAVVEKQASQDASPIATTVPVVIMPDIVIPESDVGKPDEMNTDTDDPPQPASVISGEKDSGKADSDEYPPFSYIFFFGEYVPYYRGWYYYSDRWIWGRRLPRPPEPPGWIPPPPPPRPRPLDPVRPDIGPGSAPRPGNGGGSASGRTTTRPSASAQKSPDEPGSTIPVVPSRHRIPRKNETEVEPLPKNSNIPVAPSQHRVPAKAKTQDLFPSKNDQIPIAPGAHRIPRKNDR